MVRHVTATPTVSVVICAYTGRRWGQLCAAVASVAGQTRPAREVLLVVDHNPGLAERARTGLPGVRVLASDGPPGLSGARNTGIAYSIGEIIAFLDDDATASPDWLERLLGPYADPAVLAVGGAARPQWPSGSDRPGWLPASGVLDWVVGCSYLGQPTEPAEVRNLMGCNMSFRRSVFDAVGGFSTEVGRLGALPLGCEETELCIRARWRFPGGRIVFEPRARVGHAVSRDRIRWSYLRRRGWAEGVSKAVVTGMTGARDALSTERRYLTRVLPAAAGQNLRLAVTGRPEGVAGLLGIGTAVLSSAAGYLYKSARQRKAERPAGNGESDATSNGLGRVPILTGDLYLDRPLPDLDFGGHYRHARLLVWLYGRPIGQIQLPLGPRPFPADRLAKHVWARLGDVIADRCAETGTTRPGHLPVESLPPRQGSRVRDEPAITVVVATRDRTESLLRCLASLRRVAYSAFDVVVVDSAPRDDDTAEALAARTWPFPLRYLRAIRPGLALAHNTALSSVTGEIVAFTDDDVEVHPDWLGAIAGAFRNFDATCVTGLILPAELETEAQCLVEQAGGFARGFDRRAFIRDMRGAGPLFPFAAGRFGSGANMAFRTAWLAARGGFDPATGAGSPARGGDDLTAFLQVIIGGGTLVYEPAAVVRHWHRRDYEAMRRQSLGYGMGLGAYLAASLAARPALLGAMLRRTVPAVRHLVDPASAKNARREPGFPRELVWRERAGLLAGPLAYALSRWRCRDLRDGDLSAQRSGGTA